MFDVQAEPSEAGCRTKWQRSPLAGLPNLPQLDTLR
jgi:hypothetical protein